MLTAEVLKEAQEGVCSRNRKNSTLSRRRRRNVPVQRRNGHAEVLGYVLGRNLRGRQDCSEVQVVGEHHVAVNPKKSSSPRSAQRNTKKNRVVETIFADTRFTRGVKAEVFTSH